VSFVYDSAGNQTLKQDPRGYRTSRTFDAAQRLTVEQFGDGARNTYAYDPAGNRIRFVDSTGTTTSVYDAKDRTTVVISPSLHRISYSFNAVDHRIGLRDPDNGRFTTSYDAAGRVTLLINPQSKRTTSLYDAASRLAQQKLGNGVLVTHLYDNAGRQTGLIHRKADGTLLGRLTCSYDSTNNRTLQLDSAGVRTSWAYDALSQLTSEQRNGGNSLNVSYRYDPAGNRTLQIDSGTRTTSSYDSANQLTLDLTGTARTTYTHDNCGDRIRKDASGGTTFYTWNAQGKLAAVEPPSGTVTLSYDAVGHRVKKQTPTATTNFLYDFKHVLQERDGNDATQREYSFQASSEYGDLVSQYDGSNTSYHEFDALGSTSALISDAAAETDKWVYRAFGLQTQTQGTSTNPLTFVGKQGYYHDSEAELYLCTDRYYEPTTGRFISEDPIGYKGGDWNLYRYCGNNPVNAVDPSGLRAGPEGLSSLSLEETKVLVPVVLGLQDAIMQQDEMRVEEELATAKDLLPERLYPAVENFAKLFQEDLEEQRSGCPGVFRFLNVIGPARFLCDVVKSFLSVVWTVVKWVASAAWSALSKFLPFIINVAITVVKFILGIFGFNTKEFSKIADDFGNLARGLIKKGPELIHGLLVGVLKGFKEFFGDLGVAKWLEALKEALFDKDITAPVPTGLEDSGRWTALILDVLGLGWDDILAEGLTIVEEQTGSQAGIVLLGLAEELTPFLGEEGGGWGGLIQWGKDQLLQNVSVSEVKIQLGGVVLNFGKDLVLKKGLEFLIHLNPFGGIVRAIKAAWGTYTWIRDNWDKLSALLATVKEGLGLLVTAVKDDLPLPVQEVTRVTVRGLEQIFKLFVSYVVRIVVGNVAGEVQKALKAPREFLFKKVRTLLTPLAMGLKKALDGALAKVGLQGKKALVGPVAVPGTKWKVWVDEDGKAWLTGSPDRDLVQEVKKSAGNDQARQKCVKEAEQLSNEGSAAAKDNKALKQAVKARKGGTQGAGNRATSRNAARKARPAVEKKKKAQTTAERLANDLAQCGILSCKCTGSACPSGIPSSCFRGAHRLMRYDCPAIRFEDAHEEVMRVRTLSDQERLWLGSSEPETHSWRHPQRLWFFADKGKGDNVSGWLLREATELTSWQAQAGEQVWLDLPEQGVHGWAWVQKIEDRPELPQGPGRLVTGWFRHERGQVYDLQLTGVEEVLGVTATHPFWSVDRNAWVPAGELRKGDRLLAADGSTPAVESFTLRAEPEPVYNIEVEGDHCYRVGEQGLLVHNASTDPWLIGNTQKGRVIPFADQISPPDGGSFTYYKPTAWSVENNRRWIRKVIEELMCEQRRLFDIGLDPDLPKPPPKPEIDDEDSWVIYLHLEVKELREAKFRKIFRGKKPFTPKIKRRNGRWVNAEEMEPADLNEWRAKEE
jgi:RHS repeat-associated protein